MAEQGDAPDLSQSPKDREVLEEIARLIKERKTEPVPGLAVRADPQPERDDVEGGPDVGEEAGTVAGETGPITVDFAFVASLMDAMPAGVALCTRDTILCANAAFALAFGYRTGDEVKGAGGLGTLFPRDAPNSEPFPPSRGKTRMIWTAATRSGRRVQMPVAHKSFDHGARTYWLLMLHPAPADGVGPHERGETAPVLQALAAAKGQGTVRLSADGVILAVNDRAASLLGRAASGLRGVSFETLFAGPDAQALRQARARLSGDGAQRAERRALTLIRSDGGTRTLEAILAATPDDAHCPLWALLEALPGQAPGEGGGAPAPSLVLGVSASNLEFLAKISHEIRTPLNSIIGFAEFMKEERLGPIGNVKYRGYIDDIHQSGQHALSLINDLLDLSKIESGNFEPNFTAVDANEVIAECVKLIHPQAQRDRVVVRMSLAPHLPPVLADRRSLTQIALNLLSNAVKFTESGGQVITATSLETDGAIKISVRDTGVGMTEAEIEQAMTPFRQLDTAPRKRDGTGLGLPLTKALVEANRATMHVMSRPRSGTRIDVVFPADRIAR